MFERVYSKRSNVISFVVLSAFIVELIVGLHTAHAQSTHALTSIDQAFDAASQEFGVPDSLLKAICYMEGGLSNHDGKPSSDNGYGCMHLVNNEHADTLDQAAKDLNVSTDQLKSDMTTNIRGGAAVLHDDAIQLSSDHSLPSSLADWYPVVEKYSNATTESAASTYTDAVFKIINTGFSATADDGETVTLAPQAVTPNIDAASHHNSFKTTTLSFKTPSLPQGCTDDGKTDYSGAIDCILNPNVYSCTIDPQFPGKCAYNCKLVPLIDNNCTYTPADRPHDTPVQFVVIHDTEGTLQNDLKTFQDPTSQVGIHYLVDSDGTIYQLIHDQDITYHAANFLYNDQSVGIEHVGFDATGYTWYNTAQYLGSAKLVAYLLDKYNIPLDHDHIVSHGTIPAAYLKTTPNHVDPGPYWLWDYYFHLIEKMGGGNDRHAQFSHEDHMITLHPHSASEPLGGDGHESKERNFNFFSLYQGPSTNSGLIPQPNTADVTDETANVEPDMTYYYVDKAKDSASDDTMYEIWYGEADQLQSTSFPNNELADAKLAWLAVPPGDGVEGEGTGRLVSLHMSAKVYSHPNALTNDNYLIAYVCNASGSSAPNCQASDNKAIFVSTLHFSPDDLQPNPTEVQDGAVQKDIATTTDWYEINFNHRQAWVPSAEVTLCADTPRP